MSDELVSWPAGLPGPVLDGFTVKRKSALRQAEMEVGPNRQRRLTSTRTRTVTARWIFTDTQSVTFETFFDTTLHSGADWFNVAWRLADGRQTRQVRFQNGEFESAPQGGRVYQVTATLDWRG